MAIPRYEGALREIMRRSLYPQRFYQVAGTHKERIEEALRSAETCLSIGPAEGEIDIFVIQMFMPNLKEFHGVDLNKDLCGTLKEKMKQVQKIMPDLEVTVYQEDAAIWEGLGKEVDVLLCFGTLYNFKDTEAVLHKFNSWLKPGGLQWVTFNDNKFIGHAMKDSFDIDRGNLFDVSIRDVYAKLGFQIIVDQQASAGVCLRNPNKEFLQMVLMRPPTDEELARFIHFIQARHFDIRER
ncbi:hypothetical protein CAPTEDRAFT_223529 [Capitella teleta]|uniref:Methyltransferase type 12 domain-containing protein n=1 Tax=Capitella teleta TaxID=283909 RepID=R7TUG3_CAPTE|nr:hypothetical protein CAPTEDRAFT_223529 [Capitella teleta]|eukprot:ELT97294.1 hypothetical protein CAPTEDRAFT_223529 [Capitella teleta]